MKKLVYIIKPTGYKQGLFVYDENNKKIEEYQFFLSDFDDVLKSFVSKYENVRVDFIGSKLYSEKLIKRNKDKYTNIKFNLI